MRMLLRNYWRIFVASGYWQTKLTAEYSNSPFSTISPSSLPVIFPPVYISKKGQRTLPWKLHKRHYFCCPAAIMQCLSLHSLLFLFLHLFLLPPIPPLTSPPLPPPPPILFLLVVVLLSSVQAVKVQVLHLECHKKSTIRIQNIPKN